MKTKLLSVLAISIIPMLFSFQDGNAMQKKQLKKVNCHQWADQMADLEYESDGSYDISDYEEVYNAAYAFYYNNCSGDLIILEGVNLP